MFKDLNNLPPAPPALDQTVRADFERAHFKAFLHDIFSWLMREDNDLLPFDEVQKHLPLHNQHYLGMQEIPVDKIIGSVGRYQDFDRAFLPKRTNLRPRWVNIDRARLQDINLPPIEVYKVGDAYFVKDGNHRVSVARQNGQAFIDAEVIEWNVPVTLNENTRIDDLIREQEQAEFLQKTHLLNLIPDAKIEFSLPGMYDKLIEHIQVHRWYMGIKRKAEVPFEEAVISWYKRVYLPLVQIIREKNILDDFPGRTETDLYLWIIEHQWYLAQQRLKSKVTLEEAATHFVNKYSRRPWRRLKYSYWKWRKKLFKLVEDRQRA